MEITYRGFTINDEQGLYEVQSVEGLYGVEVRTGADVEQPRGDGSLPGRHFVSARHINLQVRVFGDPTVMLPPLLAAFQPSRRAEPALTWTQPDGQRLVYARVVASPVTLDGAWGFQACDVTIGLKATDPRIYGPQHLVPLTPFDVTGAGGFDYPVDYPKQYGADVLVDATAWNAGDSDAHPTVRVRGPESGTLQSFELVNVTNGSSVRIDTTVTPGQLLTVRMREWVVGDPAALIVELDGSSRYGGWVTRPDVLWLSPGSNVLRLLVLDGSPPVSAEIVFRDTWAGTRREGDV